MSNISTSSPISSYNSFSPNTSPYTSPYSQSNTSKSGISPFDIVTRPNLKPSKSNHKKKKSNKSNNKSKKKKLKSKSYKDLHKDKKSNKKTYNSKSYKDLRKDKKRNKKTNNSNATDDTDKYRRNRRKQKLEKEKNKLNKRSKSLNPSKSKSRKPAKSAADKLNINVGNGNVNNKLKGGFYDLYMSKCGEYNNIYLINDFSHICEKHNLLELITETKKELMSGDNKNICILNECISLNRMYRDRYKCCKHNRFRDVLYLGFINDINEIITQQLMDKIHSHYFHSFHLGCKITEQERKSILCDHDTNTCDDEKKQFVADNFDANLHALDKLLGHKKRRHTESMKNQRNSNKFLINVSNTKQIYGFGRRFFYWDHYKNNNETDDDAYYGSGSNFAASPDANYGFKLKDWYILARYNTFKEELLQNELCCITSIAWDILESKAIIHINTDRCKKTGFCARGASAICYDMVYRQSIKTDHFIAIMIYCNFDQLQQVFSGTFRYLNENESDSSLKKRHANYYFLAKNLRELIECFGTEWSTELENIRLYHGINKGFMFKTLDAFIKGPLSTTTNFSVAFQFCDNNGMILDVNIDPFEWVMKINETEEAFQRLNCFDCQWVSDYPYESEVLFIGGLSKFTFNTIIEAPATNHYKYIHALKQMTYFMSNGDQVWSYDNIASSLEENQFVFRLLSHELSRYFPNHKWAHSWKNCPQYFKDLLHSHCASIKMIDFRNRDDQESAFHEALFKYDCGWIKLDLITTLFPNIAFIIYEADKMDVTFLKQSTIYNSVIKFVTDKKASNKIDTLPQIHIVINANIATEIKKYIHNFVKKFEELSWTICVNIVGNVFDGVIGVNQIEESQQDARIIMKP
eukprot:165434_1